MLRGSYVIGDGGHMTEDSKRLAGTEGRGILVSTAVGLVLSATIVMLRALNPSVALAETCPNEPFRVGLAVQLPDCRAYEQVSPVDKNGAGAEGLTGLSQVAPDGSRASFYSQAGTPPSAEFGGTQEYSSYAATRGSENWTLGRQLPPQEDAEKAGYLGSTPNLRFSLVEAFGRENKKAAALFLMDNQTQEVTQIVPYTAGKSTQNYAFDGASSDGSRVFFESRLALTGNALAGKSNLYMWSRASGALSLVGVLPGAAEEAPEGGAFGGAYDWYEEPSVENGGALALMGVGDLNAINASGDQIFFTAGETGQLYVRRGLDGADPTTTLVSEPNPGVSDPAGTQPAAFQEATPDGSRVFFISSEKLTEEALLGPPGAGSYLYEWNEASEELVDIAPGAAEPGGSEVLGLIGVSETGTSGYFVARAGDEVEPEKAVSAVYRFQEAGDTFEISEVAPLNIPVGLPLERELTDSLNISPRLYGSLSRLDGANLAAKTARVSADGNTLLFTTNAADSPLVKESAAESCTYANTNTKRCPELYRYSAPAQELQCISCDPGLASPMGPASLQDASTAVRTVPRNVPSAVLSQNMSRDGSTIFFETPDALLPQDVNGASGCPPIAQSSSTLECQDVYEWEAPGALGGTCRTAEVNGGCLYLISGGQSDKASYFLGASADGASAFFFTYSQLVPADIDESDDLYAAAVGGGIASQFASPSSPCVGEACLMRSASAPAAESPGSAKVEGPGNAKKKQHKKKQHKKKQHKKKQHKKKNQQGSTNQRVVGGVR